MFPPWLRPSRVSESIESESEYQALICQLPVAQDACMAAHLQN